MEYSNYQRVKYVTFFTCFQRECSAFKYLRFQDFGIYMCSHLNSSYHRDKGKHTFYDLCKVQKRDL